MSFDPQWLASAAVRAYNAYGAAEAFRQSAGLPSWSSMAQRASSYFPARLPQYSRALVLRSGYGGMRRRGRVGYFDPRRLPAKYRRAPLSGRRVPGLRSRKQRSTMNVALMGRLPANFLRRSRAPPRFSVV